MAAPPSTASAETQQIQQRYAEGHGAAPASSTQTASAVPTQALSGSATNTATDVTKPKSTGGKNV
jgi:hypothetical protein